MKTILKAALIAVMILGACHVGYGQTVITMGPISTTDKIEWTIAPSDAATAVIAQGLPLRIRDNGATAFVTVNASGCVPATAPATGWTCTTNVTTQLASTVNVRGTHSLVATWFDTATMTESPNSVPFVLTVPGAAPTGLRIIR